ncbi:hypothetical protein [Mucilaginibacter aquaedulcis]|uniref:hypothetical protein n=1 Tax=Mucilaginibacter aquaedulcis TaxID=1187081 RepID=UPI0025B39200|nr:hypothetical protein [Mucilaginibacter aquaedulcis]MDN3549807.1 hypothetical protein [Mucilaginibacter aquaedulcis]
MKKLILLAVLGLISLNSLAQAPAKPVVKGGSKFSVGAEGGLPTGDVHLLFGKVIGGSLKYEIPVAANIYFTISAGYNSFILKKEFRVDGYKSSAGFVPCKLGIKGYVEGGLFLEGQLGVTFSTADGGGNAFTYAPGLGYTFNGCFEAGARYEAWSNNGTIGQAGLRLAYRF